MKRFRLAALTTVLLCLAGCASIGPGSMTRDRFDYNVALTDSWKRQVLLNVVKVRYVEPISFVDVGQIVSAYTLESDLSLTGSRTGYDTPTTLDDYVVSGTMGGKYTDRPTITYTPLTGKTFLKSVMLPIPVQNLLQNIESGASADIIFIMSASCINGLRNEGVTTAGFRPADRNFTRAVRLMRALQLEGLLRIKIKHGQNGGDGGTTLGFPQRKVTAQARSQIAELKTLLGLDPARDSFRVTSGNGTDDPGEIAINCYSIMQILASLAIRVDVPPKDVQAGRATPGPPVHSARLNPLGAHIHSGTSEPTDAFTSVRFRHRWFWVDDSDMSTNRLFSFILMAFTLTDEAKHDSPVHLTLPAN